MPAAAPAEAVAAAAAAPGCGPHAGGLFPPDRQEEYSSLSSRRPLQLNPVKGVETQHGGVAAARWWVPTTSRKAKPHTGKPRSPHPPTAADPGGGSRGATGGTGSTAWLAGAGYKEAALGTGGPRAPCPPYLTTGVVP